MKIKIGDRIRLKTLDEVEDEDFYIPEIESILNCLLRTNEKRTKVHEFSECHFKKVLQKDGHSFGWALKMLKNGKKVARKGWNDPTVWLELQSPSENSKMTSPYIYIEYPNAYPNGSRCPWFASQTDMLLEDWVEVEE